MESLFKSSGKREKRMDVYNDPKYLIMFKKAKYKTNCKTVAETN